MELFGHSFSHFNASEELDRKLVILHLANAVELILKDLVLDTGTSIYKGPKETITIHGAIKALQEQSITVPFLNKIELLIDERNALQHRFGSPNELTTIFYMNIAQDFFREVLRDRYDQDYNETVSQFVDAKELAAFQMREPSGEAELENLRKLSNVHPLGALLSAMSYLEKAILNFGDTMGLEEDFRRRSIMPGLSHRTLERYGVIVPEPLREKLDETRRLRNMAAHGRKEPSKHEVNEAINTIEEFEKFLGAIDADDFRLQMQKAIDERNHAERLRREKMEAENVANKRMHTEPAITVDPDGEPSAPAR